MASNTKIDKLKEFLNKIDTSGEIKDILGRFAATDEFGEFLNQFTTSDERQEAITQMLVWLARQEHEKKYNTKLESLHKAQDEVRGKIDFLNDKASETARDLRRVAQLIDVTTSRLQHLALHAEGLCGCDRPDPGAGASPTEPTVPDTTEPTVPDTTEPTVPDTTEPAVPDTTEPAVPDPPDLDDIDLPKLTRQAFFLEDLYPMGDKLDVDRAHRGCPKVHEHYLTMPMSVDGEYYVVSYPAFAGDPATDFIDFEHSCQVLSAIADCGDPDV
ncbi:hypothetical protein F5Y05DRAFT_30157 [Hypoxylon sp. FL0543]|nr:hypothetical protein F5Y05DRAFT_30157 [Hypoxylon sp. FL0543]